MFTNWVTAGGNLIAMRPDKKLAGLLGLDRRRARSPKATCRSIRPPRRAPGSSARRCSTTAPPIATRSTARRASRRCIRTPPPRPATPPSRCERVGTSGGQAAAFTYDLAKSVVYTRQGNPAWAGQERDGTAPIRSDDLFFGGGTSRTTSICTRSRSRRPTSSSGCSAT